MAAFGVIEPIFVFAGAALKKRENEKGIITRFVIGRRFSLYFLNSHCNLLFCGQGEIWLAVDLCTDEMFLNSANRGDSLDQDIDSENKQTNDFFILVCLNRSPNFCNVQP